MNNTKNYLFGTLILVLAAILTFQAKSLQSIKSQLAGIEARMQGDEPAVPLAASAGPSRPDPGAFLARINYGDRLQELEAAITQLTRATDYLMERGQLPLATAKIEDLQRKLMDPATPERERLQSLRLLRRNKGLSDEALQHTITWLQTSKDGDIRREVLQQLDITNAAMREPLLNLAASDSDSEVREEAVENLRQFLGHAQVENRLWEMMRTDPDAEVREQAEEALREGPMSPERLARLKERATDPQASLEEKLTALRAMRRAGADSPEASADLAQLVQSSTDPAMRARVFDAWDGSRDPSIKAPLVHGLQDQNPIVRTRAADALSSFVADPAIKGWLDYIAQTDPDPLVRREASQSLMERQRR